MAKKTESPPAAVTSKSAWQKLTKHHVTCPSGAVVRIRIPNLASLVAMDAVPEQLKGAALREIAQELVGSLQAVADGGASEVKLSEEDVKALYELNEWMLCWSLIEPEITPADLPELPEEDLEMLVQIVSRERDVDARGVRLGVEPLSRLERFRHHHECPPGCEACEAALRDLSEIRGDEL